MDNAFSFALLFCACIFSILAVVRAASVEDKLDRLIRRLEETDKQPDPAKGNK